MKVIIVGFVIMVASLRCESKEKGVFQYRSDSMKVELAALKIVDGLKEADALIDSIDASRYLLQLNIIEGNNYADYITRLRAINVLIKRTETKLEILEESNKNASKAAASSIRQLRSDLENLMYEATVRQLQVANLNKSNMALMAKVHENDTLLFMQDLIIKLKESEIANLARMNVEAREKSEIAVANLYYAQAALLEQVANRTQFAPNKKKTTRREALELYKLALSLGNQNAQVRIDDLEKELS